MFADWVDLSCGFFYYMLNNFIISTARINIARSSCWWLGCMLSTWSLLKCLHVFMRWSNFHNLLPITFSIHLVLRLTLRPQMMRESLNDFTIDPLTRINLYCVRRGMLCSDLRWMMCWLQHRNDRLFLLSSQMWSDYIRNACHYLFSSFES